MPKPRKRREQPTPAGRSPLSPQAGSVAAAAERAGCQREAAEKFEQHDILFLLGPAGVGKTWVAINLARGAVAKGNAERVVVTRPAVECGGERLGFLPGEANNKLLPYMLPFHDVMRGGQGESAEREMAKFEVVPLAYIRGRTFSECVAVLDEAQNATLPQLRAYLTRIGAGGKLLVVGDPGQSDLAGGGQHLTILADEMEKRKLAGVVRFPASAIVRHPLIQGIEKLFTDLRGK